MEHNMFEKPFGNERKAIYYIENMVFRTSTLWDTLAQLCNIFWGIKKPIDKIYTSSFFHDYSQGKKDRKSTRLNSSHVSISYAVFCLKKKKKNTRKQTIKQIIK